MIEELKEIKSDKKKLREFGLTIGIIFVIVVLVAFLFFKKPINIVIFTVGIVFVLLGAIYPYPLKPLQKAWMGLAIIIGFFISRIILSILFYLVISPVGLIMRIFGKDILDQKIGKNVNSYWKHIKGVKSKESYEKQY